MPNPAPIRKLFLWRAWTRDRRIADCGCAWGTDEAEAQGIAQIALGGPLQHEVASIELEIVRWPRTPLQQVTTADR